MYCGLIKSFDQSTDAFLLLATRKDVDKFFEGERTFQFDHHSHLVDSTTKINKMTKTLKNVLMGI